MSSTGALSAGTLVAGRYQVQEPLAGEGSAAVYRAADTRLNRAVALRALPAAEAGGAQQGKAAARLVHPNVARVLDFGSDTELALEFVVADLGTGGSLTALLAQRGVPPLPLALRMVQEAAAGLAAAHRAGLVHGDLHPGVLWLSRDEGRLQVRVLGLGLNPVGSPPPRATARYAAPERLRRSRELTAATDVFSLGVIAYEVFAGLPADWTQLLLQMARGQAVVAPSLLETRPDLPAHVAHAVRRALMSDPASRWPDAGELAAHLIADVAAPPQPAAAVAVPAIVSAPAVPQPRPAPSESTPEQVAEHLIAVISADDDGASESVTISESEAPASAAVDAEPETVQVAAPASIVASEPVIAEVAPVVAPTPAVAEAPAPVAAEPVVAVAPEPMPIATEVVAPISVPEPAPIVAAPISVEAAPVAEAAPVQAPPAEPVIARAAGPEAPARQPKAPSRTAKPIALASTDLADTLYIPPALEKPTRAAASAPAAATPAPMTPPAGKIVAPPPPVASTPVAPPKPEPVVAAAPEPVVPAPKPET
ncbi:protein kinase domain-containing protein, partial [Longimicrobium sp.]|uniref:protein kinase domain-containing protein n=1 Tax=Longimicrobium sp. TaxID=2029185 RepID=UPI002E34DF5D